MNDNTAVPLAGENSDRNRYRLIVRGLHNAPSPRHGRDNIGILVLNHDDRSLPREGDLADEIDVRLHEPGHGDTPEARLKTVTDWLVTEHGATVVLAVFAYDGPDRIRFQARRPAGTFSPPFSYTLAGVIYDTPQTRENAGVTPASMPAALATEVSNFDRWLNDEVFQWVIQTRASTDTSADASTGAVTESVEETWRGEITGTFYDHHKARQDGERVWREMFGSVYVENDPHGPTDAGDPGGDAQLSTAYSRRFHRRLTDGELYGVVDVECYVVNTNMEEKITPVLRLAMSHTVCTDPDRPGDTEQQCYLKLRDFEAPPDRHEWETAARNLCAEFDHLGLDWDGEYIL